MIRIKKPDRILKFKKWFFTKNIRLDQSWTTSRYWDSKQTLFLLTMSGQLVFPVNSRKSSITWRSLVLVRKTWTMDPHQTGCSKQLLTNLHLRNAKNSTKQFLEANQSQWRKSVLIHLWNSAILAKVKIIFHVQGKCPSIFFTIVFALCEDCCIMQYAACSIWSASNINCIFCKTLTVNFSIRKLAACSLQQNFCSLQHAAIKKNQKR